MNAKMKTLLGIVLFIIFLGGAYYAYKTLSVNNRPDLIRLSQNENNQPSPTGSPNKPSEVTPAATGGQDKPSAITPTATGVPKEAPEEQGGSENEDEGKLKAFDFTVYDAQGNEVKLSDFYGKPIIINFWTTWCPYCVEEMPIFEQAYQKYGSEIQFLMIDCVDGQQETQAMGESFIQEKGFTFPVYYDTQGGASATYQVYSLPTSVFIDKDSYVVVYYPGAFTADMLQQGIDYILTESVD